MNFGDWFKLFPEDYIKTNYNYYINTKKPINYDTELIICDNDNTDNLDFFSLGQIYLFFKNLKEGNVKINLLNGKDISTGLRNCDYCGSIIESKNEPTHICKICKKTMCNLCMEEKNEDIALKNGAKNWNRRKDKLIKCFSHLNDISRENIIINCDICNCSSKNIFGYWHTNRELNKDICPTCFYNGKGTELMDSTTGIWEMTKYINELDKLIFGSFLDWVPVAKYIDSEDIIFYNINKDSILYQKIALAHVNKDNKYYIYTTGENLSDTIDILENVDILRYLEELEYIDG